jgi:nitrogen regulatory protein PII
MYLLVVILDKSYILDKIIAKLTDLGVTGATIFDSMGLGQTKLYGSDAPIIASIRRVLESKHLTYNHTILSVIETQETLDAVVEAISDIVGGFDKPDTGILFTLKLDRVVGYTKSDFINKKSKAGNDPGN